MAELRLTPAAMHDLENIKEYISVTRGAAVSTFSPTTRRKKLCKKYKNEPPW